MTCSDHRGIFHKWKIGGALSFHLVTEPDQTLPWLLRLMSSGDPLDDLSDSQIVQAGREAKQVQRAAQGRAAWTLHERGWIWEKIGEALGVAQSTAYRWADEWKQQQPPSP